MRKILTILFIFLTTSLFGQDTKPISPLFKNLQSPSFSYMIEDSSVWIYKGLTYGWTKLADFARLVKDHFIIGDLHGDSLRFKYAFDGDWSPFYYYIPPRPEEPQFKFLNGYRQWQYVSSGSGGYNANLYYTTEPADIGGYYYLDYDIQPTETELTATANAAGEYLIRTYIYPDSLGTGVIDGGEWYSRYYYYINNAVGTTRLKVEILLRHTDGSETSLFSSYSDDLNSSVWESDEHSSQQPAFFANTSDRIMAKVYLATSTAATITIHTLVGDGRGAYFRSPAKLRHSGLRDLRWVNSGHNGDSNTLAGFGISGQAIFKSYGNLTESIPGLSFDATRQVIGGNSNLSLDAGYLIPTTTDTTRWGSGSYNNYIQNQTATHQNASFDISGSAYAGTGFNTATGSNYKINGVQISSSNLSDGSNLAKLNAANEFTQNQKINANLLFGSGSGIIGYDITDLNSAGNNTQRLISFISSQFQPTNRPSLFTANYWSGIEFRHNLSNDYRTQIITGTQGSIPQFAIRTKENGTWNSWYYLYHSGNSNLSTINWNANIMNAQSYQVNGVALASSNLSDGSNLAKLDAANTFTNTGTNQFAGNIQTTINNAISRISRPTSGYGGLESTGTVGAIWRQYRNLDFSTPLLTIQSFSGQSIINAESGQALYLKTNGGSVSLTLNTDQSAVFSNSIKATTATFTTVGTTTATHTLGIDANGLLTTNVSSGGATNLGYTSAASNGIVTSDTGTDATIPAATTSIAGLLTATDKTKLDGIATGADNYSSWMLSSNDVIGSNYVGHLYDVNFKSSDSSVGISIAAGGASGYAGYTTDLTIPDNATKTWTSSNFDKYGGWYCDVNGTTSRYITTGNHVNLIAGAGMTITPSGSDITFASTGGYTLPLAANGTRGGLQIGYTATGANIPLQLSSEKGYVALTKTAIETVLTGILTSHTHDTFSQDIAVNTTPVSGVGLKVLSPSSTTDAIVGASSSGHGVVGSSVSSVGVSGESSTGFGVQGAASGSGGIGVYGYGAAYDFYAGGPGVDYGTSSSIRWKTNVHPIPDALGKLMKLRGVYFNWKKDYPINGGKHDIGFIAEEVGKVVPEIVAFEKDSIYASGLDYGKITPLLLQAIKELNEKVDSLSNELNKYKLQQKHKKQ